MANSKEAWAWTVSQTEVSQCSRPDGCHSHPLLPVPPSLSHPWNWQKWPWALSCQSGSQCVLDHSQTQLCFTGNWKDVSHKDFFPFCAKTTHFCLAIAVSATLPWLNWIRRIATVQLSIVNMLFYWNKQWAFSDNVNMNKETSFCEHFWWTESKRQHLLFVRSAPVKMYLNARSE